MTSSFLQTLYRFYQIHYQILYHSKNNFEILPNPNTFYGPGLTQVFRLTKPMKPELLSLWTPTATDPILPTPYLLLMGVTTNTTSRPRKSSRQYLAPKTQEFKFEKPLPQNTKSSAFTNQATLFLITLRFLTIKHLSRQNAKKRRFS